MTIFSYHCNVQTIRFEWLVGYLGFNAPLRQYFSSKRERRLTRQKMSKQHPLAPTVSAIGPCPTIIQISRTPSGGGGRVVRWCWVNFQCRGVLLIWIRVGQGPTVLAVGAGGVCLAIFSLVYHFSFLSPSFWETARNRLKYCLKGP